LYFHQAQLSPRMFVFPFERSPHTIFRIPFCPGPPLSLSPPPPPFRVLSLIRFIWGPPPSHDISPAPTGSGPLSFFFPSLRVFFFLISHAGKCVCFNPSSSFICRGLMVGSLVLPPGFRELVLRDLHVPPSPRRTWSRFLPPSLVCSRPVRVRVVLYAEPDFEPFSGPVYGPPTSNFFILLFFPVALFLTMLRQTGPPRGSHPPRDSFFGPFLGLLVLTLQASLCIRSPPEFTASWMSISKPFPTNRFSGPILVYPSVSLLEELLSVLSFYELAPSSWVFFFSACQQLVPPSVLGAHSPPNLNRPSGREITPAVL